jgi:RNA recognition motif-containing protein
MGTRLFVGNLSYNVTELELKEAFTSEGIEVRSVRVACERETGRPRGFAFVETASDDAARSLSRKPKPGPRRVHLDLVALPLQGGRHALAP